MKFNLWRQLRLAGAVIGLTGVFIHNWNCIVFGVVFVFIGTVNGLLFLENRVSKLEEDNALHSSDKEN